MEKSEIKEIIVAAVEECQKDSNREDSRMIARDFAFWVFTAISGFLAWNVWEFSGSIESLTTEVKHLAKESQDFEGDISAIRSEITTLRIESASRNKDYSKIPSLEKKIDSLESRVEKLEK